VAGGVAHDFNNILMGITGSLSLLRHELPEGGKAREHCERISASAARLTDLTSQLLAVAKGTQSEFGPILVGDAIREALGLIGGVVRSRLQVVVDEEESSWPIEADRVQIERVVLNLCLNAWDATGENGRVTIGVRNVARDASWESPYTGGHDAGEYVALAVADDGCGMTPETLEHLFEPFFSTKTGGSGLGLAAVHGIVRRHGGAIHVRSRPGEGTEIEILFPRSRVGAATEERDPARPAERTVKRKILLVDDEPVVREVAAEMLEVLGFRVESFESGPDALGYYRGNGRDVDLVLLDVQMPRMSGIEASRLLRDMDPDVRILLTSGHTESIVREDMPGGGGVHGFIQKPYTLEALEEAIGKALA
jgi:CheY-like chemotaxis protein